MKKMFLFIGLSIFAIILSACGETVEPTMSSEVGEFTATTQDNEPFTQEDLQGSWWVADFIFTKCTTVCPPMTRNMAQVQKDLAEAGIEDVKYLSFSVDPEYDTPEILKEYGKEHGANFDSWTFLTGYDFEMIETLSLDSFKSILQAPAEGDDQVMHGTRFYVINPEGVIVNSYIGTESEQLDQLVNDVKILAK